MLSIVKHVIFSSSLLKSLSPGNCSPIVLQGLRQQWIDLILSFIRQLPNLQSHGKSKVDFSTSKRYFIPKISAVIC